MALAHRLKKPCAAAVALLYFTMQVALSSHAESTVWEERKHAQSAALSPSSMLAVERAGRVASASEAELVVVTAYDPVPARDAAILNLAVGNL